MRSPIWTALAIALAIAALTLPANADGTQPSPPVRPGTPASTPGTPVPPAAASPQRLAALVSADDARASIAVGPSGEIYEPDGKGGWVRRHTGAVASEITTAARAGQAIVVGTHAGAYRLITSLASAAGGATVVSAAGGATVASATGGTSAASPAGGATVASAVGGATSAGAAGALKVAANAWSVVYLGQHAKPITAFGGRALAAVGRQLFALDRGAPTHLADAATPILAIGAGPSGGVVVLTDHGALRLAGKTFAPIAGAPQVIAKLVSDRWALVDHGAFDLKTSKMIAWPAGFAATAAASTLDDALVAIGAIADGFEIVTVRNGKLDREHVAFAAIPAASTSPASTSPPSTSPPSTSRPSTPPPSSSPPSTSRQSASPLSASPPSTSPPPASPPSASPPSASPPPTSPGLPVAVVADRAGRVVIAFADGRIAIRDRGAWTTTSVRDELPPARPGSPPATSR